MESKFARSPLFVSLLALVILFAPSANLLQTVARADDSTTPTAEQAKQTLVTLQGMAKALELLESRLDPTRYDLAELAKSLQSDPVKCFEYVRDRIYLEPYAGYLRGPKGTLLSEAGNALDRASLLAELLRADGKRQVRIVHGSLSKEDAKALLDQAIARLAKRPAPKPLDTDAELKKLAEASGIEAPRLAEARNSEAQAERAFAEDLGARVKEDTTLIKASLKSAGVVLGADAAPSREVLVALLQEHFWVQTRAGDQEKWQNLDPSFADATPGGNRGTPGSQFPPDAIPAQHKHSVTVRVVLERGADGKREETPILEKTLSAAECVGESIVLTFAPDIPDAKELMTLGGRPLKERLAFLDRVWRFQPVLQLGTEPFGGRPFDLNGETFSVPSVGVLGGGDLGSPGKAAASALDHATDALNGAMNSSERAQKSCLLSLRLEWTVGCPGRQARTFSRTLFDLLPAEQRAAGKWELADKDGAATQRSARFQLIREHALAVTPGPLSQAYVDALAVKSIRGLVDSLIPIASAVAEGKAPDMSAVHSGHAHHGIGMHPWLASYETARQARLGIGRAAEGLIPYYAEPSVAVFSVHDEVDAKGNPTSVVAAFDVLVNPVSYLRTDGYDPAKSPALGLKALEQGVTDTHLERVLQDSGSASWNASTVLHAARAAGIPLVTLTRTSRAELAKLDLPAAVRAQIEEALTTDHAVIVPRGPVTIDGRPTVAWWRVDPGTGRTLGILEDGSGGAIQEYVLNLYAAISIGTIICTLVSMFIMPEVKLGNVMACALASGAIAFGAITGPAGFALFAKVIAAVLGIGAVPFGFGSYKKGSAFDWTFPQWQ